jgi:hypothetical protein
MIVNDTNIINWINSEYELEKKTSRGEKFRHRVCILSKDNKYKLCGGINQSRPTPRHAEYNAFKRFKCQHFRSKNKKMLKINILSMRFSSSTLQWSDGAVCAHCAHFMNLKTFTNNSIIKYVYYTHIINGIRTVFRIRPRDMKCLCVSSGHRRSNYA